MLKLKITKDELGLNEKFLTDIFINSDTVKSKNLTERFKYYYEAFKGIPYGSIDYGHKQHDFSSVNEYLDFLTKEIEFKYDFEKLDCVTFVEAMLALLKINLEDVSNSEQFIKIFEENLISVRYNQKSKPTFINRNHFTSAQWLPGNSDCLEDVTNVLSDKAKQATANINGPAWIAKAHILNQPLIKKSLSKDNNGKEINLDEVVNTTTDYLQKNNFENYLPNNSVKLPYLTNVDINDLIKNKKNIFSELNVLSIVNPGWELTKFIGTQLNVSHQGFSLNEPNKPILFIHSTTKNKAGIVEQNLTDYIENIGEKSAVKGFNIQKIKLN